jgi:UDP-2,3-diacylglucosamine hydrolase
MFLSKSLEERRAMSAMMREKSKEAIAGKPAEIMDVNAGAVRDAFRKHGVTRLIHGHTHRPAHHQLVVDGHRCERWVLADWYRAASYLRVDDSGVEARVLETSGHA